MKRCNNKPFSLSNKTFSELQNNKINNKNSGYYVVRKRQLLDEDKIIQTLVIKERIVNGVINNKLYIRGVTSWFSEEKVEDLEEEYILLEDKKGGTRRRRRGSKGGSRKNRRSRKSM